MNVHRNNLISINKCMDKWAVVYSHDRLLAIKGKTFDMKFSWNQKKSLFGVKGTRFIPLQNVDKIQFHLYAS